MRKVFLIVLATIGLTTTSTHGLTTPPTQGLTTTITCVQLDDSGTSYTYSIDLDSSTPSITVFANGTQYYQPIDYFYPIGSGLEICHQDVHAGFLIINFIIERYIGENTYTYLEVWEN